MFTAEVERADYSDPWALSFDERFARLSEGTPRAAYFYTWPDTSTFRYRAYNVSQALAGRGGASACWFGAVDWERMGRVVDACDVLVLCRNSLYTDRVAQLAALARARGRRVLFDCDDLVFDPAYIHLIMDTLGQDTDDAASLDHWFAYIGRIGATYALCDGALVTNDFLAERARAWSGKPVRVLRNALNREQEAVSRAVWEAKARSGWARDGRRHLGYFSGSPSHNRDFGLAAGAIGRVMDDCPDVWLRVVGYLDDVPELARHRGRIEVLPMQDFVNLQREIGAVEVNLVPLQDNDFTNCKSELKWFEAAAVGTLTVATPTFAYRGAIRHGETGWLAGAHEWEEALRRVLEGEGGHQAVLEAARGEALRRFGWERQAEGITAALFEG